MGARAAGFGSRPLLGAVALTLAILLAAVVWATPRAAAGTSSGAEASRYSLARGCYALRSQSAGRYAVKSAGAYRASSASVAGAEPLRMQATDLGRYLFYGAARDFMAVTGGGQGIVAAGQPSNAADWTVRATGGAFTIINDFVDRQLAVAGDGRLVAVAAGSAGSAGMFTFGRASGCPRYPEAEVNASGTPTQGSPSYGEVIGTFEGHMHGMAFEFLGGKAHCGRPWHRFGAPVALVDCADHKLANGCAAVLENVLFGNPVRCHDHVGWPTFKDWPHHQSLTHEQSYYRWLERAWMGGTRLYVNLMVENRVLCEIYPFKKNSCNEMNSVLLQIKRIYEFQDYVDAQAGGPGKGFFRIVTDPFEAREVINDGKMAVVLGMEVSEPFGCKLVNEFPACGKRQIDGWIERLHDLGLRQFEITNKFDNALTGVTGDNGTFGTAVNVGNFYATGRFWDLEHCDEPVNHDHTPTSVTVPHNDDLVIANGLLALLPPGALPVYPDPPWCNSRGLSPLGEHAIRGLMQKGMIFDPDHMSVRGRNQAMDLVESERYPGLISSHSWSTPNALPRIYRLGGVIAPSAGSSESFVHEWEHLRDFYAESRSDQYFGVGYGADQNGFASQGGPREGAPNPVRYPFEGLDDAVTFDRQRSGARVFDINVDGVAHYGLYPDWIEDLRMIAGERIVDDLGRGAEAYLQMWERTEGIAPVDCDAWEGSKLSKRGVRDRIRLGAAPRDVLESAGQPVTRSRAWRWCAGKDPDHAKRRVAAVFTGDAEVGIVLSTLRNHRAAKIKPGTRVRKLRKRAHKLGRGLWVRKAGRRGGRKFVYSVRGKRVRAVAVASRSVASKRGVLRRYVKRARTA